MAGNRDEEDKVHTQFETAIVFAGQNQPTREARETATANAVKKLIDQGLNVNARRKRDGLTPLARAVFSHQLKAFQMLVAAGADMNAKVDPASDGQSGYSLHDFIRRELMEYEGPKYEDETEEDYKYRKAEVGRLKVMEGMILKEKARPLDEALVQKGINIPEGPMQNIASFLGGGRKSRARRSRKTKRRQTRRRR